MVLVDTLPDGIVTQQVKRDPLDLDRLPIHILVVAQAMEMRRDVLEAA